jgi:hypothetical protein
MSIIKKTMTNAVKIHTYFSGRVLSNSLFKASFTVIQKSHKQGHTHTTDLQTNILDDLGSKNPQENAVNQFNNTSKRLFTLIK